MHVDFPQRIYVIRPISRRFVSGEALLLPLNTRKPVHKNISLVAIEQGQQFTCEEFQLPVKSRLEDNKILMSEVNNHLRYNGSCMYLPAVLIFETVVFLGNSRELCHGCQTRQSISRSLAEKQLETPTQVYLPPRAQSTECLPCAVFVSQQRRQDH